MNLNYAMVGGAPEAYGSHPVCICVCLFMSFALVSLQRLKGKRCKLQRSSNATISSISIL